jgi:GTP-binding protein
VFDKVKVLVMAGDGGDGAVSFRREKYVPFGGPDGGDGGNGGEVAIVADLDAKGLREFGRKRFYRAGNGGNGRGQKKHGKNGKDLILRVPVGTMAWDGSNEVLITDFEKPGQQAVVVRGGKGGLGNTHFASSTNQAPRIAQKGEVGEETEIVLELRLIADVGIIGYPNAGKSTLLAVASAAKPKIAGYPFTTLEPILGLAEIPGLIDGAHIGRGLGHDFLRHIMRTKIVIHLIDGTSVSPVEDMIRVNTELGLFDSALAEKRQIVVINKVDLPQVKARLDEIREAFRGASIPVLCISAVTGEGVAELMAEAMRILGQVAAEVRAERKTPSKVFHPQRRGKGVSVHKKEDTLVVVSPELERIIARVDMANPEVRWQVRGHMVRMGVSKALERAGVKPGDKVRCGSYEWEW